jgi:hypothetical protein
MSDNYVGVKFKIDNRVYEVVDNFRNFIQPQNGLQSRAQITSGYGVKDVETGKTGLISPRNLVKYLKEVTPVMAPQPPAPNTMSGPDTFKNKNWFFYGTEGRKMLKGDNYKVWLIPSKKSDIPNGWAAKVMVGENEPENVGTFLDDYNQIREKVYEHLLNKGFSKEDILGKSDDQLHSLN